MKFRSLILAAVAALALSSPGFAQTTPAPTQQAPKAPKPFDKITIYVTLYNNEPNDVAANFLESFGDKSTTQGATLLEGQAETGAPNAFEFRVFLYSAPNGTATLTINFLAHTQGNVYPEYLGAGTVVLSATNEAEVVGDVIATATEAFTSYLATKKTSTVQ